MGVSFSFPWLSSGNPLFPSTPDRKDDLAPGLNPLSVALAYPKSGNHFSGEPRGGAQRSGAPHRAGNLDREECAAGAGEISCSVRFQARCRSSRSNGKRRKTTGSAGGRYRNARTIMPDANRGVGELPSDLKGFCANASNSGASAGVRRICTGVGKRRFSFA